MLEIWDYLIVTASGETQAKFYRNQLDIRRRLGLLGGFREVLVVADPLGQRVGSGGSTICSILKVMNQVLPAAVKETFDPSVWLKTLQGLRILILHAGGDARRLPIYGPCGKIFVPLPGESDRPFNMTIFDRQLPTYQALPRPAGGFGQIVITSGDVLLDFDPESVRLFPEGITALGCYASPEKASNHGVFRVQNSSKVELYLQKPTPQKQMERRAISRHGQTILDIGVMSLSPEATLTLIGLVETKLDLSGELVWAGPFSQEIISSGLDFYREICCAMGTSVTPDHHLSESVKSGSSFREEALARLFNKVSEIPFFVHLLPRCSFQHFGTLGQLISSGNDLLSKDYGVSQEGKALSINNVFGRDGEIKGSRAWVEGSRIEARLSLGGQNVVSGLDITETLNLPPGFCLDVQPGRNRDGRPVYFVRCFGTKDSFGQAEPRSIVYCDVSFDQWLRSLNVNIEEVYGAETEPFSLWNARLFPAVETPSDFRRFLWMFDPSSATPDEREEWLKADRYSHQDINELADQALFFRRRLNFRTEQVLNSIQKIFGPDSGFSAKELAFLLSELRDDQAADWCAKILRTAFDQFAGEAHSYGLERLELSRILHTLGSAISQLTREQGAEWQDLSQLLEENLDDRVSDWLDSLEIGSGDVKGWANQLQNSAFENLSRTIVLGSRKAGRPPVNVLRSDEIVWGRAPARLDLGGGWSDTPPYTLEHGGCVINAAVNLNGQPPIQVYARVTEEPLIRMTSIDHGTRGLVKNLDELLCYREPTDHFALAKAALVLSGFSQETSRWPEEVNTLEEMLMHFGGGIELTTLAAIPSGSGLGTSSIMGAVLTAVINRMLGNQLSQRELFNRVLQLEQELTTGGGWQDQIGGAIGGVKLISTEPDLVPDPRIHFVPSDLISPLVNKGQTLLYYTGLRRLAKSILRGVVGNYLDRDRFMMHTLRSVHSLAPQVAESLSGMEMGRFGALIDQAWTLNQQIDPDSTTREIDEVLGKLAPHLLGAKLLGAGGGGFLLMVARSVSDAQSIRSLLTREPPNARARFFEYDISAEGLAITVC